MQNTTLPSRQAALDFPKASLAMAQCATCSFVWNDAFSDDLIQYDETYNNDVLGSAFYRAHLEARADDVIAAIPGDTPIHYVEIGCGEADFLRLVVERSEGRVHSAVGFDPSFSGKTPLPACAVVHREFFTSDSISKISRDANIFCSRHTIEHIAEPRQFTECLSNALRRDDQVLFIETPSVDWIFENAAFYDFFFEHCSLFTPHALRSMFGQHGLKGEVRAVYGAQYLWAEIRKGAATPDSPSDVEQAIARQSRYVEEAGRLIDTWTRTLQNRTSNGRIGIWGTASKGVTFALIMRQAGQEIGFAIDLNRQKQGCFMPLTGIEIQAPDAVGLTDDDTVIVMNPNYLDEIRHDIAGMSATKPRIVCL
ncbi:class I SAM-dependent methyltransferase [Pseudogemmobacter sp. W21_MBD1_M6]|uniref:class I SAM-dependent methyltransferase n=1 Tax=Pseudogemmobacter sp. W21_MBD1_M6 TaxID=3240271 RepID=UPI003F9D952C